MTCDIYKIMKKSISGMEGSLHKLIHSINKLEIPPLREI